MVGQMAAGKLTALIAILVCSTTLVSAGVHLDMELLSMAGWLVGYVAGIYIGEHSANRRGP